MKPRCKRKVYKKAFIADALVDLWAYLMFVLVVIVFAIIYKMASSEKTSALENLYDVTYGNYLAQVYLRTPIIVGNAHLTMAELISMYDYNQTLEPDNNKLPDGIFNNLFDWSTDLSGVRDSSSDFFFGTENDLWKGIKQITDDFVVKNFDKDKCYVFSIKANGFEYSKVNGADKCKVFRGMSFSGEVKTVNVGDIALDTVGETGIPEEAYLTYLPSIDPRKKPIEIYSIYDAEKLFGLDSRQGDNLYRQSMIEFCKAHPQLRECQKV